MTAKTSPEQAAQRIERSYRLAAERALDEIEELTEKLRQVAADLRRDDPFVATSSTGDPLFEDRGVRVALARVAALREAYGATL